LLVRADQTWGTLGDEALDTRAVEIAHALLREADRAPKMTELERQGQGPETALFERIRPSEFNVALFGAGHVGRALVRVLGTLPCSVTWVDSRASEFPREAPPNVRITLAPRPLEEVARARPGSHFIVMTHSHALDFELVEAILKRGDFAYCGMIGSRTKRETVEKGLAKHGVSPAALARFTCPVGIASIKGKEPGTIAVAVAAQLLEVRERMASTQGLATEPSGIQTKRM